MAMGGHCGLVVLLLVLASGVCAGAIAAAATATAAVTTSTAAAALLDAAAHPSSPPHAGIAAPAQGQEAGKCKNHTSVSLFVEGAWNGTSAVAPICLSATPALSVVNKGLLQ